MHTSCSIECLSATTSVDCRWDDIMQIVAKVPIGNFLFSPSSHWTCSKHENIQTFTLIYRPFSLLLSIVTRNSPYSEFYNERPKNITRSNPTWVREGEHSKSLHNQSCSCLVNWRKIQNRTQSWAIKKHFQHSWMMTIGPEKRKDRFVMTAKENLDLRTRHR